MLRGLRDIPVGVLVGPGLLVYPHVKWQSTDRILSAAGWRWEPGVEAWVGHGEPPVPFTRRPAS